MEIFLMVVAIIFVFDLIDSSAGQGLGTVSAPLLLMLGFSTYQVIPSLVIVAAMSGLVSGWFHHEFENVHYSLKKPFNDETKTVLFTAGVGSIMIASSVVLVHYVIQPNDFILSLYIAITVILMGLLGLIRVKKGSEDYKYRPKFIVTFAAIAGFNKGVGGGGYGPVLVMGNILSGIYEKTAAALTQTTEGIVSTVGAVCFFALALLDPGSRIDFLLLPSMFTGSFFASVLAPYILRVLPNKIWKVLIPAYAFMIGIYFVIRLLL